MTSRKIILFTISLAVLLGMAAIYFLFDPSSSALFPKCIFLSLTDLKCPGCGSQRAIHALLNGNLAAAWNYNALLVVSVPVLPVYLYAEFTRTKHVRLYRCLNSPKVIIAIFVAVIAWWVLRNIFNW
jgi:hypothetical protein